MKRLSAVLSASPSLQALFLLIGKICPVAVYPYCDGAIVYKEGERYRTPGFSLRECPETLFISPSCLLYFS